MSHAWLIYPPCNKNLISIISSISFYTVPVFFFFASKYQVELFPWKQSIFRIWERILELLDTKLNN